LNIHGTYLVSAPPTRVYEGLIDPRVLERVIPGCERLELTGPDQYNAHLKIGLAALKGSYVGKVHLSDKLPDKQFTLHMDGKGAPGFVKGTAHLNFDEQGSATRITLRAQVQVGGLIAAVGSRVIEAVAKKLTEEFFQNFGKIIAGSPKSSA